jgi:Rrf2 family transcriptional regulator, nitric oxide-sensitive transcriptional repressor
MSYHALVMQLTRFTDYALRVLLFVGRQDGRRCTLGEIATYYGISLEHLRKVVHRMAKLGYLSSSRGRRGGITLGRNSASIRIGDVIRALESNLNIIDCDALECRLRSGCSLKRALDRGRSAFLAVLNEVTLADLLGDQRMRRQLRRVDLEIAVGR